MPESGNLPLYPSDSNKFSVERGQRHEPTRTKHIRNMNEDQERSAGSENQCTAPSPSGSHHPNTTTLTRPLSHHNIDLHPDPRLTLLPHPNPLRDVRMGERPSLPQPPPQVTVFGWPAASISGPQPVLQALERESTPLPEDREVTLKDRDIESIPRPSGLSKKNLRAEMWLDKTEKGKACYNTIRNVVRHYMSESFWMDWNEVSQDRKKWLRQKVYHDERIPIIKRYKDHWATDEIAKTTASGRRRGAYSRGEAIPSSKYAHNAANSKKRNPNAPRGRWDSVSQSVVHKDKDKKVQHAEEQAEGSGPAPSGPLDRGNFNVYTADTLSLNGALTTSLVDSHGHPSYERDLPNVGECSSTSTMLDPDVGVSGGASSSYHWFRLSAPHTPNDTTAGPKPPTQGTPQPASYSVTETAIPQHAPQQNPNQQQHLLSSKLDDLIPFDQDPRDEDLYESKN